MYIIEIFNIKTEETFKMFSLTMDLDINRELFLNNLNNKNNLNNSLPSLELDTEYIKRTFLFKNVIELPNTKFCI